mmetsp:Transcript_17781/g.42660  ORF Transcript_17781/g.42660 Transcript_17781/m.42660 type:complete len:1130 (+) Transcript_17781:439-3828(+)
MRACSSVVGLHWVDIDGLAVATAGGYLQVFDASGNLRDQVLVEHSPVGSRIMRNVSTGHQIVSYQSSVVGWGSNLTFVSSSRLTNVRLLLWRERLALFRELGDWAGGISSGLQILDGLRGSEPRDGFPGGTEDVVWPFVVKGADINSLPSQLLGLFKEYVSVVLENFKKAQLYEGSEQSSQAFSLVSQVASLSVQLCVRLGTKEELYGAIYDSFKQAGQGAALLRKFETPILRDQLPSLEPEPLQDLVRLFVEDEQPQRVERCVLHLNVETMDLNQVFRLCRENRLYSALIYVNNRALGDYVAPACDLLVEHARSLLEGRIEDAKAVGYKLLLYLRCCVRGEGFPPGAPRDAAVEAALVRSQAVGWLLLAAASNLPAMGWQGPSEHLAALPPGPHGALRLLTSLDTAVALSVLAEALTGWDAAETELLEALRLPTGEDPPDPRSDGGAESGLEDCSLEVQTASQVAVNAVVSLLSEGASWPSRECALRFVGHFVSDGRAAAPPPVLLELLRMVAAPKQSGAGAQLSIPDRLHRADPTAEETFLHLTETISQACSWQEGPGPERDVVDPSEVLRLAEAAGFCAAAGRCLHLSARFPEAIAWHLNREGGGPGTAFDYVESTLAEPNGLPPQRAAAFRSAVMGALPSLTNAAPDRAARLVMAHFAEDQEAVIDSLRDCPELQWRYLDSAMQAAEARRAADRDNGGGPRRPERSPGDGMQGFLSRDETCELYVRLMCRFDPGSVLPFLTDHETYRPTACLAVCEEHGVRDAAVYLRERMGDARGAFDICLEDLEVRLYDLKFRALTGQIDIPGPQHGGSGLEGRLTQLRTSTPLWLRGASKQGGSGRLPPEVGAAHASLQSAIGICRRHCASVCDSSGEDIWFQLFRCPVEEARKLKQARRELTRPSADLAAMSAWGLVGLGLADKLDSLEGLLLAFTGDVLGKMSGYVPLEAVVLKILDAYGQADSGDFKECLMGILSAYSYERSILVSAAQLIRNDAFRFVTQVAQLRRRGHPADSSPSASQDNAPAAEASDTPRALEALRGATAALGMERGTGSQELSAARGRSVGRAAAASSRAPRITRDGSQRNQARPRRPGARDLNPLRISEADLVAAGVPIRRAFGSRGTASFGAG